MRKRTISMARAYLAFYILFVFSGAIAPVLAFKYSGALSIILIVLDFIALGGLIASNVFYNKENNKLLYIFAISSLSLFDAIIVLGFILELVFTIQGQSATYAWVMSVLSIIAFAIISFFIALGLYRVKHPKEKIY